MIFGAMPLSAPRTSGTARRATEGAAGGIGALRASPAAIVAAIVALSRALTLGRASAEIPNSRRHSATGCGLSFGRNCSA